MAKTPAMMNPNVLLLNRRPLGTVQVNVLLCTVSPLNMLEAEEQQKTWRQNSDCFKDFTPPCSEDASSP